MQSDTSAEKDNYIITGGCSFTAHTDKKTLSWARQLESELGRDSVIHAAQMGSGNQIICDRLCYELSKPERRKNAAGVVVMWSSPFRKEFLFTHEDPDWRDIYNGLRKEQQTTFTNYFLTENNEKIKHPMSNWLIIGGGYGIWDFGIPSLDRRIRSYFDNNFSKAQCYVDTCRAIITLQSLCKSYGVPLMNMCWQNIFHDVHVRPTDKIHGNGDRNLISGQATMGWLARRLWDNTEKTTTPLPENMKAEFKNKRIEKMYPDCKHWMDMIDWDTWFFYENDSVVQGGLQEFRYWECGDFAENLMYHPPTDVQNAWMKLVKKELIKRGMIGANNE